LEGGQSAQLIKGNEVREHNASLEANGGILEVNVGSELGCSAEAVACIMHTRSVVSLRVITPSTQAHR
jgi:hypothetical protein